MFLDPKTQEKFNNNSKKLDEILRNQRSLENNPRHEYQGISENYASMMKDAFQGSKMHLKRNLIYKINTSMEIFSITRINFVH